MGPNYDCASSILLCAEDNISILDFDDDVNEVGVVPCWDSEPKRRHLYEDFLMDFPLQSDECLALMIEKEPEHLPREDYAQRLCSGDLDIGIRMDAVDWILKVHAQYNFGPLSAYLAINYLDRFLSAYALPRGNVWMTQLLSVACLSLATKMEETEVPLSLDLQVAEAKYVFEAKTIQRMELLVLSTLRWRMQAVTPFSFIDFFLNKFSDGNAPSKTSVSRCVELILSTIRGVEFLASRPSEIAAAVVLSVLGETQFVDVEKAMSCCSHLSKVEVLRCHDAIQDRVAMSNRPRETTCPSGSSVPQSPIGVLDAACLSYKSDDTTVGSHATCHHTTPVCKRRKITKSSNS